MRRALFAACFIVLAACAKKEEPAKAPAAAPSAPAAAPAASPAGDANRAEPHRLSISNWPKSPVTATLNGEWIGQWDQSTSQPLPAVKGKNELQIEIGGKPDADITVHVEAERAGSWVRLLTLNFKDKPGKHETMFVAK